MHFSNGRWSASSRFYRWEKPLCKKRLFSLLVLVVLHAAERLMHATGA